jgi:hypothetical protein
VVKTLLPVCCNKDYVLGRSQGRAWSRLWSVYEENGDRWCCVCLWACRALPVWWSPFPLLCSMEIGLQGTKGFTSGGA